MGVLGVKSLSVPQLSPSHPVNAGTAALCFTQTKAVLLIPGCRRGSSILSLQQEKIQATRHNWSAVPVLLSFTHAVIASPPHGHPQQPTACSPLQSQRTLNWSGRSLQQRITALFHLYLKWFLFPFAALFLIIILQNLSSL